MSDNAGQKIVITKDDLRDTRIDEALALVRDARDLLRCAGAPQAYKRVRSVVHSVEGAARHAGLRAGRGGER